MGDYQGLFGAGAPQSVQGLDPDFLAQLQAASQARQGALAQLAQAPQAAAPQSSAPPVGMPQAGGLPQVKPGVLDYVLGALFQHKTPLDINAEANMANLAPQVQLAQMQQDRAELAAYQRQWGGQGGAGAQAPQGAPDGSGAAGGAPAPIGLIGGGAPQAPPTVASQAPILSLIARRQPELAKTLLQITTDAQPEIEAVGGRMVDKKSGRDFGPVIPGYDPASATGGYADPNSPTGYSVANPSGAVGAKGVTTFVDQYQTNQAKPPVPGAVMGPNGWIMPATTRQTVDQANADAADATKHAEARYAYAIAKGTKQADVEAAAPLAYGTGTGTAGVDRVKDARTNLDAANSRLAQLKALSDASDRAGTGSLNPMSTTLASAYQTFTGKSMPKVEAQQAFAALAPSMFQSLPGLQVRNEREFALNTQNIPKLVGDPQFRHRAINFARQVEAQKAREAQLTLDFANGNAQGANGTKGMINGRPATLDDYISRSRARNPLIW
jgi:hypothetical protein